MQVAPVSANETIAAIATPAGRGAVGIVRLSGADVLLLDTAGRTHIDEPLMAEMAEIKRASNPHELLLVADSLTGQDAVNLARNFDERVGITGRILYLAGEDDALIDAGQCEQIRAALTAAGVDHEVVTYPGVGHAFFWPGTPPFNAAARDDAWSRILALLARG